VITLDTSGLFALLNSRDIDHGAARQVLTDTMPPYIVPTGILAEIAYLVEQRMPAALDPFLADLESGAFSLDCGEDDLPRIRELISRYADLSLGFAEAAVIACTERSGGSVLSFDRRDFGVVAREGKISLAPG
jgi:predicted nucleic acid-binding protein